jgi:isoleucyl-tRNA synthetase
MGEAIAQVDELLLLRSVIGQGIEKARQQKLIGNALEAAVVLRTNSKVTGQVSREDLEEFFILSDLTVESSDAADAEVTKTRHQKCARCWRHRPTVGTITAYPDLCDRCANVVREKASA